MTNYNNKNIEDYNKKDVKFTEGLKPVKPSTDFDGDTLNTLSHVRRKKKTGVKTKISDFINTHARVEPANESVREILMTIGSSATPSAAFPKEWNGFDTVIVTFPKGTTYVARNRTGKSGVYISKGELLDIIKHATKPILITPFEKVEGKSK